MVWGYSPSRRRSSGMDPPFGDPESRTETASLNLVLIFMRFQGSDIKCDEPPATSGSDEAKQPDHGCIRPRDGARAARGSGHGVGGDRAHLGNRLLRAGGFRVEAPQPRTQEAPDPVGGRAP